MKNQPNKATVKGGLPTAHSLLSDAYQRHGWLFQPDVLPSGACPHENIAMEAMQEYSDQQNAELMSEIERWKQVSELGKKSIRELIKANEKLESVESDNSELRQRVKELEAYKEYEMTFGSHLLCRIKVSAKGIEVIGAVNGWGDAISSDEIKIQTLKK